MKIVALHVPLFGEATEKTRICRDCGFPFDPEHPKRTQALCCVDCHHNATCRGCGSKFKRKDQNARYCSNECFLKHRWRGHRKTQACVICGIEFSAKLCQRKTTCSTSCRLKASWLNEDGRNKRIATMKANPTLHSEARKLQLDEARAKFREAGGLTEESIEKIRQARLRQRFPQKMTDIERILRDRFLELGYVFEMNKTMFGRFQPDFVFEDVKLIVQADGEYWHKKPEGIERDARFNETAEKNGWTVLRFKGQRIMRRTEGCIKLVQAHMAKFAQH